MYVLLVTLKIKPEHREEFIKAAIELDAKGSVETEPGAFRFDVIADDADPNTIHYYEVYRDRAAFAEHQRSEHFARYRDLTQPWLAAPTVVSRGDALYPPDEKWQKQPG